MKYKFADFNIEISSCYDDIKYFGTEYMQEFDVPDLTVFVSNSEIDYEKSVAEQEYVESYIEIICAYRQIAEWLPFHQAFLMHSATFDVDGEGVAFAAHSGTGKTTHMRLWYKYVNGIGKKMLAVNGDKPIVRFFEDEPEQPYAYGTPWNGKEHLGCNMRTPLKHICFIERSDTNFVEKMDKKDAIDRIFNQVYMPKDPIALMKTTQLIDRLLSCCNLWIIHCNMEPEAAEVAYKTIFSK